MSVKNPWRVDPGAELWKRGERPQKGRWAIVPGLIFAVFAFLCAGEGEYTGALILGTSALISFGYAAKS